MSGSGSGFQDNTEHVARDGRGVHGPCETPCVMPGTPLSRGPLKIQNFSISAPLLYFKIHFKAPDFVQPQPMQRKQPRKQKQIQNKYLSPPPPIHRVVFSLHFIPRQYIRIHIKHQLDWTEEMNSMQRNRLAMSTPQCTLAQGWYWLVFVMVLILDGFSLYVARV